MVLPVDIARWRELGCYAPRPTSHFANGTPKRLATRAPHRDTPPSCRALRRSPAPAARWCLGPRGSARECRAAAGLCYAMCPAPPDSRRSSSPPCSLVASCRAATENAVSRNYRVSSPPPCRPLRIPRRPGSSRGPSARDCRRAMPAWLTAANRAPTPGAVLGLG